MTQSMQKPIARALIIALVLGPVVRADQVVYVSMNAAAPFYGDLDNGSVTGQTGTVDNPFGSIQAAYHFLWNKAGTHEIRLEEGLYSGAKIGWDNNNRYDGFVFLDAGKLSGNPAWSSVTLRPDTGPVTIERVLYEGNLGNARPGAYEYLGSGSGNLIDRNGLFRLPTGAPAFNGMIFEDLTIDLGGGTSIVGSQGTGVQEWTFKNVEFVRFSYGKLLGKRGSQGFSVRSVVPLNWHHLTSSSYILGVSHVLLESLDFLA